MPPPILPDVRGMTPEQIDAGVNSPQAAQSWADWVRQHGLGNPNAPGYAPPGTQVNTSPVEVTSPPASNIPMSDRGATAREDTGECPRSVRILFATFCWSDLIVYSASVGAILVGAWSMFLVRR